ncbi:MAG: class I SAM-dependent methyltransferase [Chloroflexota bacterium]
MLRKDMHEDNRQSWNSATDAHNSHKIDQVGFFRNGGSTLYPEEIELLGDLTGKSLVHLQCNSGQDSLSLARLSAKVTGVDISDTAIAFAQKLSTDTDIPATFVRSDVYDWFEQVAQRGEQYDIAFSSYGAIVWLSDIGAWAKGVASILKPGGKVIVLDFHPIAMTFDWDWTPKFSYFRAAEGEHFANGVGDYVAMSAKSGVSTTYNEGVKDFINPHPGHEFSWNISEILTALIEAGLNLKVFKEYPYFTGVMLRDEMRELEPKHFYPPERMPSLPMLYGLVAEKTK